MPLYDFECTACGERFEELAGAGDRPPCPACGAAATRRVYSPIAGPHKWHIDRRFAAESNARRAEREAARLERFAEARRHRAAEGRGAGGQGRGTP